MSAAWVLILFLKWGYAGGVVAVDMPTKEICEAAIVEARHMESYTDSRCVRRAP